MKFFLAAILVFGLTGCVNSVPTQSNAEIDQKSCDQLIDSISGEGQDSGLSDIALNEDNFPTIVQTIDKRITSIEEKAIKAETAFRGSDSASSLVYKLKISSERMVELLKSLKEAFERYPNALTLDQWAGEIKQNNELGSLEQLLNSLDPATTELLDADVALSMFCVDVYSSQLESN